jgi:ribosomal protein L7/L12
VIPSDLNRTKKRLQFSHSFFLSFFQKKEEQDEEEGARPTAQSVFKVRLIKFDETKKVPVIKQVKDVVENINLVQVRPMTSFSSYSFHIFRLKN